MMRMHVERDVMVSMRDGVRLATDIYRPDDTDRHPVLVQRTPYSKSNAWFVGGLIFNPLDAVQRGYVVIVQDTRGRFGSEGAWEPFVNEAADGFDTIEWAASQAWSSGNVGIYGSSYMGVTTVQAALAAPPHLKAALAYVTGANYHQGWTYSGGAFELGFNAWWTNFLGWDTAARVEVSDDERQAMIGRLAAATADPWSVARHLPLADIPAFQGPVAAYWQDWIANPTYNDYWARLDAIAGAERIQAPMLQIAGWYDNFLHGQIELHQRLQDRPHHRMVIGPWDHEAYLSLHFSAAGQRDFGPAAIGGPTLAAGLAFDWFDHWLTGAPSALVDQPRVRYFQMGENNWREAESWPPPATPTRYYLHSGGRANTRNGDGALSQELPTDEPPDRYRYDPANPVPSTGGRTLQPPYGPGGVQNQAAVEDRDDVLVYDLPALTQPLTIAGNVTVTLYAASSAPDTDFTAKLVDVGPDGFCANIAEGIIRARYRNGISEELLTPGEVTEMTIDVWDVAYTFQRDHVIRLELSSSNFPRFSRNLNCATRPERAGADEMQVATQEVHHDGRHASFLTLPVVG
ncbi:MAG: CocE/NonD family hydrolase [Blastochloris sp.]|nr:CocE/NonD family hydrolase [Blastochloris sp.]